MSAVLVVAVAGYGWGCWSLLDRSSVGGCEQTTSGKSSSSMHDSSKRFLVTQSASESEIHAM